MPITPTTPGVYVAENAFGGLSFPSGGATIAAFVGRAPWGPLHTALSVSSFAEFQGLYGGLAAEFPLTYAVRDFFANGGAGAVIARLYEPRPGGIAGSAQLLLSSPEGASAASPLVLRASSPGAWGNMLRASVDTRGITDATVARLAVYGLTVRDLFNLTLEQVDATGEFIRGERFLLMSSRTDGLAGGYPQRLDRALAARSELCCVESLPLEPPTPGSAAIGCGGDDGEYLSVVTTLGDPAEKTGLYLLDGAEAFQLLCIPPDRRLPDELSSDVSPDSADLPGAVRLAAATLAADRRAFYLADAPLAWEEAVRGGAAAAINTESLGITGQNAAGVEIARNAAVYFPHVMAADPLRDGRLCRFAPCGMIAGVFAATDAARGIWKAPAGPEAGLAGVDRLSLDLTDEQDGVLSALGINCLRSFPAVGPVIWEARTLRGADAFADDYKYVPVRRLALSIEASISVGMRWAVFEPNNEELWSSLRLGVDSLLANLARQGAFYGYFVRCDATTTTAEDIANGVVNIVVGFAPVRPAEFVVLSFQQICCTTC